MDGPLLPNMANCSNIDRNFLLPIHIYQTVHLFIKESAHCATTEVQCSRRQVECLTDMSHIHIDVTICPFPIFPLRSLNNGCPDKDASSLFKHLLTQSSLTKLRTETAFLQKNQFGLFDMVMIQPRRKFLDSVHDEISLNRVEGTGRARSPEC